jgi:hypothetical protein
VVRFRAVPLRAVVLRAVVFRAAVFFLRAGAFFAVFLRAAVFFRPVVLRAAVFFLVVRFAAVFLRAVVFLRPVVFRAAVFFLRAGAFFAVRFAVDLRAAVFLRAVLFRAVVFRAVDLRAVLLRAVLRAALLFVAAFAVVFFAGTFPPRGERDRRTTVFVHDRLALPRCRWKNQRHLTCRVSRTRFNTKWQRQRSVTTHRRRIDSACDVHSTVKRMRAATFGKMSEASLMLSHTLVLHVR